MSHIKVEGHPGLIRDKKSGAILNINKPNINAAKLAKKNRANERERLDHMENEIGEIKELLLRLIESSHG